MTVLKNSTIIREAIEALTFRQIPPAQAVHDLIRDILDTRSAWLHAATADITQSERRLNYNVVAELDGFLLDTLVLLPDYKPEYQPFIKNPLNGQTLWLMRVEGEQAVYASWEKWKLGTGLDRIDELESETDFFSYVKYNPTPRRSRYEAELSTARQVLEVIKDIEAVGKSAVSFGDGGKIDLEDIEAEPPTV